MTKKEQAEQERAQAVEYLREYFPNTGDTVNAAVIHRSASGMTRHVAILAINNHGRIGNISHLVARATGYRQNRDRTGVVVGGCGFSATGDVVMAIASAIHGDPYALNECAVNV